MKDEKRQRLNNGEGSVETRFALRMLHPRIANILHPLSIPLLLQKREPAALGLASSDHPPRVLLAHNPLQAHQIKLGEQALCAQLRGVDFGLVVGEGGGVETGEGEGEDLGIVRCVGRGCIEDNGLGATDSVAVGGVGASGVRGMVGRRKERKSARRSSGGDFEAAPRIVGEC